MNIQDLTYKILYHDKKLLKSYVKKIKIDDLLQELFKSDDFKLKAKLILGIVLLYVKKNKYLLNDCNELLLLINTRNNTIKVVKNRNINLVTGSNDIYIGDCVIDDDEFSLKVEEYNDLGNIDFTNIDYSDVEAVRNDSGDGSTILHRSDVQTMTLSNNYIEIGRKKRKIVLDDNIEYELSFYKSNICNQKDIVDFRNKCYDLQIPHIIVASDLENKLKIQEPAPVEVMRENDVLLSDFDYNEPLTDIADDYNYEANATSTNLLDAEILPKSFVFNSFVSEKTRNEKSKCFLELLNMLSEGKLTCTQQSPFSDIIVEVPN